MMRGSNEGENTMQEYVAGQDCVIPGKGIVRGGQRVTLSARAAKYLLLKGWITPAPPPPPPATPKKGRGK